jgi:phosphate acyltransferase
MIAVDAMGGDFAPEAVVLGSYQAACRGIKIVLFGDSSVIVSLLAAIDPHWSKLHISLADCSQVIAMDENPVKAVRTKTDSSLVRSLKAVATGTADAVVTAGHSGAALVGGSLILGKVRGLSRPAIGTFVPKLKGSVFCLDLGANADAKPEHLRHFALMGKIFVQQQYGWDSAYPFGPTIALLSNGSEQYKGSQAVKMAYDLLAATPELQFIGNVEPNDIFTSCVDVVVCDGFVGNIMLKTIEGTVATMGELIRQQFSASWWGSFVGLLSRPFLQRVKRIVDHTRRGGALLLGVQKPLIIAHGRSQAPAIENAIVMAHEIVQEKVVDRFNRALKDALHREVSGKWTSSSIDTDSTFAREYEL